MFVSVVLDPGDMDSAKAVATILTRYSFKKVQRACWESMQITETKLSLMKQEIDTVTDYYDTLRIYQFPINCEFVITELRHKKWRRCNISATDKK